MSGDCLAQPPFSNMVSWVAQGFTSGWVLSMMTPQPLPVWLPKTKYSTQEAASQLMIRGDGSPPWPAGNAPPTAHYAVSFPWSPGPTAGSQAPCCSPGSSGVFCKVTSQVVVPSLSWYKELFFPGAALGISPLSDSLKFQLALMDNNLKEQQKIHQCSSVILHSFSALSYNLPGWLTDCSHHHIVWEVSTDFHSLGKARMCSEQFSLSCTLITVTTGKTI